MTMFHLPFEIAIQILSRLPVKSLLRFKSVCKTWHDLIKTPDFISRHLLTHSTLNHTPPLENCFILVTENDEISLIYNDGFNGPINLDFPFLVRNYRRTSGNGGENYFSIGGMCNGLVCISLSCFGYRLFLCNPSTRQYREIPNSERKDQNLYSDQVSFGFGFHPSANDYKLIRIVHYSAPIREYNSRADLYVMSTDTWTEIDFNKLSLFLGETNEWGLYDSIVQIGVSSATALNGVFYWPAHVVPIDQVVVMSFDMGNEVFRRIRTPECLHKIRNLTIQELDDKIALVVSRDERSFDVWVLNENESCWTNQIKVGPFPRIASVVGYEVDCDITAVGGGKNGELLVTEHKYSGELKLYSYDTKTRETIDLYCGQVPYLSCVHLCEGTLLPVMQANEIVLNK